MENTRRYILDNLQKLNETQLKILLAILQGKHTITTISNLIETAKALNVPIESLIDGNIFEEV